MDSARGPHVDAPQSPSPPDILSESTNISQSKVATPSSPPLKRPSASTSPLPSSPPALAKMASSQMHTPRGTLSYETRAPSRGTSFESPDPGPPSERERNRVMVPEERENHPKNSANTEPYLTGYVLDDTPYPEVPPESSIQRTFPPYRSREYDSSAPDIPNTSDFQEGKVGAPLLDRMEAPIATSSAFVSTRNQPKDVIRIDSIDSILNVRPRTPSLPGDLQPLATSSDKLSIVSHQL